MKFIVDSDHAKWSYKEYIKKNRLQSNNNSQRVKISINYTDIINPKGIKDKQIKFEIILNRAAIAIMSDISFDAR